MPRFEAQSYYQEGMYDNLLAETCLIGNGTTHPLGKEAAESNEFFDEQDDERRPQTLHLPRKRNLLIEIGPSELHDEAATDFLEPSMVYHADLPFDLQTKSYILPTGKEIMVKILPDLTPWRRREPLHASSQTDVHIRQQEPFMPAVAD